MIATKPTKKKKAATKFIKAAEDAKNGTGSKLQPVQVKIDPALLAIIDDKARSLGLTRTTYMITASVQKAEELDSDAARTRFILAAHKAKADGNS